MEAFVLYCAFSPSERFVNDDYQVIKNNNHLVSTKGRMPNILLQKDEKQIELKEWAYNILQEMDPFFDVLLVSQEHRMQYYKSIEDSENTKSGKFLSSVLDSTESLDNFAMTISEKNKNDFLSLDMEGNELWKRIEEETILSVNKQKLLENDTEVDFNQFLKEYFNS